MKTFLVFVSLFLLASCERVMSNKEIYTSMSDGCQWVVTRYVSTTKIWYTDERFPFKIEPLLGADGHQECK